MIAYCQMMNPMNEFSDNQQEYKTVNSDAPDEVDMARSLDERMKQMFPSSLASGVDQSALSQRLGKLLAMAASSGQGSNSTDRQNFEETMRKLRLAVEKRRITKSKIQEQTQPLKKRKQQSPSTRRQVLIETVGTQRAKQIIALIREIRVLRLRRRDLLGSKALQSHTPMVCGRGGCSANVYKLPTSTDGKLPKQVRDIFFHTAIVDALEKSSLTSLTTLPWDTLYAQGQKHVQAYRIWLKQMEDVHTSYSSP